MDDDTEDWRLEELIERQTTKAYAVETGKATLWGCITVIGAGLSLFSAIALACLGAVSERLPFPNGYAVGYLCLFGAIQLLKTSHRLGKPPVAKRGYTTPSFLLWSGVLFLAVVSMKDAGFPLWLVIFLTTYYFAWPLVWFRTMDAAERRLDTLIKFEQGERRSPEI